LKFKAMYGSVNVTDGLTVDLRFRFNTPDEAAQLRDDEQGPDQQRAGQGDVRQDST